MLSSKIIFVPMGDFKSRAALLICAGTVSILMAEGGLRIYERLTSRREPISQASLAGKDPIDLADLNYNDTEILRRKQEGEGVRILSFGDSFAYTSVKYPFTYHGVAARLLREHGIPVRTVNLGEPSISFYQYMSAWNFWSSILEQDAAVFNIFEGNDLLDVSRRWVEDEAPLNRIFLDSEINTVSGLFRRIRVPSRYPMRIMDYVRAAYLGHFERIRADRELPGPEYSFALSTIERSEFLNVHWVQSANFRVSELPTLRDGYVAAIQFARLVSRVRRQGKRVMVLLSPSQFQVEPALRAEVAKAYPLRLKEIDLHLPTYLLHRVFQEIDPAIPVASLFGTLDCGARAGEKEYYGTDTHWSREGNLRVGRKLAYLIESRWLGRGTYGGRSLAAPAECDDARDDVGFGETAARREAYDSFIKPLLLSTPEEGRLPR